MKKVTLFLAVLVFSLCVVGMSEAGFDFGLSVGDDGLKSFHLAVRDYFGATDAQVSVVSKSKLSDDEMPVVFFLATRARVSPSVILDLRLGGLSWMDISLKYGIMADAFHVDVRSGPPYGKAWGHFKQPKSKWKSLQLSDTDIVNLVNLRFMSEHNSVSPDEVMKMRDNGDSFTSINGKVKKSKGAKHRNNNNQGKKNNNNNGKGKNKH